MGDENKIWLESYPVKFEIKLLEEQSDFYLFKGHASVFNVEDRIKDVTEPGCFKRTIDLNGGQFPVCFMHDMKQLIGKSHVSEDGKGLLVDPGYLVKGVQRAEEMYLFMKAQVVDGFSYSYRAIQARRVKAQRRLKELAVGEITVAPKSMICHPGALIESVKTWEEIDELEIKNASTQMVQEIGRALGFK